MQQFSKQQSKLLISYVCSQVYLTGLSSQKDDCTLSIL